MTYYLKNVNVYSIIFIKLSEDAQLFENDRCKNKYRIFSSFVFLHNENFPIYHIISLEYSSDVTVTTFSNLEVLSTAKQMQIMKLFFFTIMKSSSPIARKCLKKI